jgi:RNA polymerase sigma-70 factor (sigma-E family)
VTFEEYVAEQGQTLLRLAYVLVRDAQLAEDLTQSALAAAYRKWRRIESAAQPEAYVRRILINAYLDSRRRRSSTETPSPLPVLLPGAGADPADEVAEQDRTRRMLDTLAPRARTVLVLRYYADLNDPAIAAELGISESGVRATASRALQALRAGAAVEPVEEAP